MSLRHASNILEQKGPKGRARLVLLVLSLHSNHAGRVAMPESEICKLTDCARSTVQDLVTGLIQAGHLQVVSPASGRRPATYQIISRPEYRAANCDDTESSAQAENADHPLMEVPYKPVDDRAEARPQDIERKNKNECPFDSEKVGAGLPPAPAAPRVAGVADVAGQDAQSPMSSEVLTRESVRAVVNSAKIAPPKGQLFYWARVEHVDDLRAILDQSGLSLDDLIAKVRGVAEGKDVRRLTALVDLMQEGEGDA